MYYLSQKLSGRVLPCMSEFSKIVFNNYIKTAKEMDMRLNLEELYKKILSE